MHIPDRHVREQSRAARIFRFCHKRCPAVARPVDVDGVVFFEDETIKEGEFVTVQIVDAVASELYGEVVRED